MSTFYMNSNLLLENTTYENFFKQFTRKMTYGNPNIRLIRDDNSEFINNILTNISELTLVNDEDVDTYIESKMQNDENLNKVPNFHFLICNNFIIEILPIAYFRITNTNNSDANNYETKNFTNYNCTAPANNWTLAGIYFNLFFKSNYLDSIYFTTTSNSLANIKTTGGNFKVTNFKIISNENICYIKFRCTTDTNKNYEKNTNKYVDFLMFKSDNNNFYYSIRRNNNFEYSNTTELVYNANTFEPCKLHHNLIYENINDTNTKLDYQVGKKLIFGFVSDATIKKDNLNYLINCSTLQSNKYPIKINNTTYYPLDNWTLIEA